MSLLESSLVGHRIRIISKAQIRYEGTLFSIRKDENNDLVLVLSQVTSFGTEDRRCEHPVKPLKEVYEHIAFRGGELVDLQLLTNSRVDDDPSIISVDSEPSYLSKSKPLSSGDAPSTSIFVSQCERSSVPFFPNFMTPKPPSDLLADIPSTPWSNFSSLTGDDGDRPSAGVIDTTVVTSNEESAAQAISRSFPATVEKNVEQIGAQSKYRGRGYRSNYLTNQRYGGRNNLGHGENRSRGSSGAGQYLNPHRNYNQKQRFSDHLGKPRYDGMNFKEDYDFDKPNAELAEFLEKIEISPNSNPEPEHKEVTQGSDITYDSNKSFFDTLSSELMDQAHGVVKNRSHRENRKQNLDTFGAAANHTGTVFRSGYRGRRSDGAGSHYRSNQRGGYGYDAKQNFYRRDVRSAYSPKQHQPQQ